MFKDPQDTPLFGSTPILFFYSSFFSILYKTNNSRNKKIQVYLFYSFPT